MTTAGQENSYDVTGERTRTYSPSVYSQPVREAEIMTGTFYTWLFMDKVCQDVVAVVKTKHFTFRLSLILYSQILLHSANVSAH